MTIEIDILARGSLAYPPLPDPMPSTTHGPAPTAPHLADGCYLINYAPANSFSQEIAYEGTLRVESKTGRRVASGDFYRRLFEEKGADSAFAPSPDPKAGVPVFPRDRYRYYLRVTDIMETAEGVMLTFHALRFSSELVILLNGAQTHWVVEDTLTARMRPREAPSDDPFPPPEDFPPPEAFPSPEFFFVGPVQNSAGADAGKLKMGRVSAALRKAIIEIDTVPGSEVPRDNGAGMSWKTIFEGVGWDVAVVPGDSDVSKPTGAVWSADDAKAALAARRDRFDLDAEWRYDILVVQQISIQGGERGAMYDLNARQGLLLSSHFVFPETDEKWGLLRGQRTGTTVAFFRTAVHEMGHAMGLGHDDAGFTIMRPTDMIAKEAPKATPFPGNMAWSFSTEHERRLRHWPDVVVRPGTLSLSSSGQHAPT